MSPLAQAKKGQLIIDTIMNKATIPRERKTTGELRARARVGAPGVVPRAALTRARAAVLLPIGSGR